MSTEVFFKDARLPHIECRRSKDSGRHYKAHLHSSLSIGAIDAGSVEYSVGSESGSLSRGELVLINPETLHSCNPDGELPRNYYVLYVDRDWCESLQRSIWNVDQFIPAGQCKIRDADLYDCFIRGMETILGQHDLLKKEQTVAELMERIFRSACAAARPREETGADIERIKSMLQSRLSEEILIRGLAEDCAVNPFTLLRKFKAATAITPHAYRMNCRIEYAKTLLRSRAELSQVALACGFYDQSHFTRCFKELTAVTPGEYMVNFLQ